MTRETIDNHLLDTEPSTCGECERALKELQQLVIGGLRHGFFECTVVCEVINGQKRRLVIKAGQSYRFVIPKEEIDKLC